MKRQRSFAREVIAAILATGVAGVGAYELIGHPARTVHIITIFFGAFGAGISVGQLIARRRAERGQAGS